MSTRKRTSSVSVGRTPRKSVSTRESLSGVERTPRDAAEEKFLFWEGVKTRHEFALKEEEVREWIEQVTGVQISTASRDQFEAALSDGRLLCLLVKVLVPDSVPQVPDDPESRVEAFLSECESVGVAKQQLFPPSDLLDKKNLVSVVYCLHELARLSHERRLAPFFTGSVDERAQARQEWTDQNPDVRPLGAALLLARPAAKGPIDVPSLQNQIDLATSALEVAQRLNGVRETLEAEPASSPTPPAPTPRRSPRRPPQPVSQRAEAPDRPGADRRSVLQGEPIGPGRSGLLRRYPLTLLAAYLFVALVWLWSFSLSRVPLRLPG